MKNYDGLLMISGGKDSCSLAFKLKEEGKEILAFNVDNGFLSDVAKRNIEKTVDILNMDLIIFKPKKDVFASITSFVDDGMRMIDVCTKCSRITQVFAYFTADMHGLTKIYSGFTKYTADACKWDKSVEKVIDGMTFVNPYYAEYDLKKIIKTMQDNGLEYDPIQTNCIHIKKLLSRTSDNYLSRELELLKKDNQIDDAQYQKYKDFIEGEVAWA